MEQRRRSDPFLVLIIVLILVASACFGISPGRNSSPDYSYTEQTAAPSLDSSLYSRKLENSEASVYLEAFDLGGSDDGYGKYRLEAKIYNNTSKQYEYELRLSDVSDSLIFYNEYDISCSGAYSPGENTQGRTIFYFSPDGSRADDGYVGTLKLLFLQNSLIESGGYIEITLSAQDRFQTEPVSVMVHRAEIEFRQ